MENTNFSKGFGFAPASPEAEIDVIQRQLDALRGRLAQQQSACGTTLSNHDRIRAVRNVCRARTKRLKILGENLFSDPAWDILLEVYLSELEQRRAPVTSIGRTAAVPLSTVLRWLVKLEEVGFLVRQDDPLDGRRVFVSLTDKGSAAMTAYLDECWPLLS